MPQCPNCGEAHVHRGHRRGLVEHLLSILYVYPFRCQLCRHQFRALQWGRRYVRRTVDRRDYERLQTQIPVTYRMGSTEYEGVVVGLSIDGCTVETATPVVRGTAFSLRMRPSPGETVAVARAVVRTVHAHWVGVQFAELSAGEHDALQRVVRRLLAEAPHTLPPPESV
jgi:hypothetical protein